MVDKVKKHLSKKNGQRIGKAIAPLSEGQIRDYLIHHPDFFDQNSDLLSVLKPSRPKRDDGVVDFHAVLLDRLQNEVTRLHDMQGTLIHASRSNMTTQARIHAAVLSLLEAKDFEHLCHIVSHDWVDMLQVDVITLNFEQKTRKPTLLNNNIHMLKKGTVDKMLGHENTAILRGNVRVSEEIYGPATDLIKAEALVRIEKTDKTSCGILAFGSRDSGFFTKGQGTELLRFLEAAFRRHMKNLL